MNAIQKRNEMRLRAITRAVLAPHFDAEDTMFLEREIIQLRAKVQQVVYPALIARSLMPKATDIAASAETYSYKVEKHVGRAKHTGYRASDHPMVGVDATEVFGKVRPITAGYDWDFNELREAVRVGLPLPDRKAKAARDTIERGVEETLAFGAIANDDGTLPALGCNGFVNNAAVIAQGIEAGLYWTNPTPVDPALILADFNDWVAKPGQVSKQAFEVDSVVLPKTHYDKVEKTPYSELTGTSILAVFQGNNKRITSVMPWYVLDSVSTNQGGDAGKPRGVAYKKDSTILEAVIPQEFESFPPEVKNFVFQVLCHARSGGVKVYQPNGVRYIDFATS